MSAPTAQFTDTFCEDGRRVVVASRADRVIASAWQIEHPVGSLSWMVLLPGAAEPAFVRNEASARDWLNILAKETTQ